MNKGLQKIGRAGVLLAAVLSASWAQADEVLVAVAANFAGPMQKIAADFATKTGHKAVLSVGSTGKFYAQIQSGAPFAVLLAADDETPAKLEKENLAVAGTRFTYAMGKLVLWSAKPSVVDAKGQVLQGDGFKHLAIANPRLAPYGQAGVQTLQSLGRYEALAPKLVQGENIAQTFQFVSTGNADLGFVALSQVLNEEGKPKDGSMWLPPASAYESIRQDAVLLAKGKDQAAAIALLDYLRSPEARARIAAAGYNLP